MGDSCCASNSCQSEVTPRYRRALWIALAINAAMFAVELGASWTAGSVSLLADAADFLGDAANYGISLLVLSMALVWRSRSALAKGATMGLYGVLVLAQAAWNGFNGVVPGAYTMGVVGALALTANLSVAVMLYAFRDGDANMRSVWLCSRNDAISNIAVILAAGGVFGLGAAWPDLMVAVIMAGLGLSAARSVITQARAELKEIAHVAHA